jgi:SAM-dependent methyltransferase
VELASSSIHAAVADYYSRRLTEHGASARGVDWSSAESQTLRFGVLLSGIDWTETTSLLDYGCGYGALADYLDRRSVRCRYVGYDIAPSMIHAAHARHLDRIDREFTTNASELSSTDHVVASGIFNIRLGISQSVWGRHVEATLDAMAALAQRTLSFNMMPPASPPERAREDLYYADPDRIAEFCERRFGGDVLLQEEYGLWEFTVTVTWPD